MAIRSTSAAIAPEHRPTQSGLPNQDSSPPNASKRTAQLRRTKVRQRLRSFILWSTAALMTAGSSGCNMVSGLQRELHKAQFLDDFMIAHRNKVMAAKAWFREEACHSNEAHLDEFKAGFLQGYADVANGASGCLPAVAPSQYWGWRYQSPDGQAAINAWFAGYPLGAKAAEQDGVGNWGNVRPMNLQPQPLPVGAPIPLGHSAPAGNVVTDALGNPIYTETIVPGSETTTLGPPTMVDPLDLGSPGDVVFPIGPEGSGLDLPIESIGRPGVNDEASIEIPTTELPSAEYSLNDLGDDNIDGIFGTIEMPTEMNSTGSQMGSVETASADSEISFKFE